MPIHSTPGLPNRLKILVTPQWGAFFEQHRPTGLPSGLLSFIKQSGQEYDWWIRIHPLMLNDVGREKLFRTLTEEFRDHSNVYWEHATDLPLPQILSQVDLHVTLSSAVTIEASWFGIRTALLGDNASDLMKWFGSEIKDGYAEIIQAEHNRIAQWVRQHEKAGLEKSRVPKIKTDSLDNFIDAVKVCVNSDARIEELLGLTQLT